MAKLSITEAEARAAAERLERAREAGEQLSLFGERLDGGAGEDDQAEGSRGRGQGKANSILRRWLAAQGFDQPERMLARMAGLDRGGDPMLAAMADAERALLWAYEGPEGQELRRAPTPRARLDLLMALMAQQRRALEALLPYGLPKAAEGGELERLVQVVLAATRGAAEGARGADPAAGARVIEAQAAPVFGPPPLPGETKEKQGVAVPVRGNSDGGNRT